MCVLIFDDGIVAESWYAWLALRMRVSMSAIGSVIVMGVVPLSPRFRTRPSRGPLGDRVVLWSRPARSARGAGTCDYQLDFATPGSSPACAISRRQIRHRPNLRKTECGRPHRWQRV